MQSKRSIRGHLQEFLIGPSLQVQARRNHIYEDAFSDLSQGKGMIIQTVLTAIIYIHVSITLRHRHM